MAKKSAIERNKSLALLIEAHKAKRGRLKAIIKNRSLSPEERFEAQLKLAKMARDGSPTRYRRRCELSGRPRGNYRKFRLSRIALRELGSSGMIPGVIKSSW